MNSQFNDKHLLWWMLQAVDQSGGPEGTEITPETLTSDAFWKAVGAPAWVAAAMREKYEVLRESPKVASRAC